MWLWLCCAVLCLCTFRHAATCSCPFNICNHKSAHFHVDHLNFPIRIGRILTSSVWRKRITKKATCVQLAADVTILFFLLLLHLVFSEKTTNSNNNVFKCKWRHCLVEEFLWIIGNRYCYCCCFCSYWYCWRDEVTGRNKRLAEFLLRNDTPYCINPLEWWLNYRFNVFLKNANRIKYQTIFLLCDDANFKFDKTVHFIRKPLDVHWFRRKKI